MGNETILFKTEEKMHRTAAANLLRQIADKLENGKVTLQQGQQQVKLKVPNQVELEVKAEKEMGKRKNKKKLEIEIEWVLGQGKDQGTLTVVD